MCHCPKDGGDEGGNPYSGADSPNVRDDDGIILFLGCDNNDKRLLQSLNVGGLYEKKQFFLVSGVMTYLAANLSYLEFPYALVRLLDDTFKIQQRIPVFESWEPVWTDDGVNSRLHSATNF